ncbi:MAG: general secretion pathway protein GspK [Defluviicoccus sp.]|nr:MAG: general secretion pathway protein GspK [Defluviicoccus sp.]
MLEQVNPVKRFRSVGSCSGLDRACRQDRMRVVERERGFALLMVLWTLILLAFLAMVFADNARTEVFLARNLVDNAQAEALADGGIYRAAAGLSRDPVDGGFYGDGRVYVWPSEAGEVRFWIRDEGGKVDINNAPAALLRELLVIVGADSKLAESLADAIIDFRDEDDDKQPHGAEVREYRAEGLGYGPKNQRIVLTDELIYVPGMTADLLARLSPFITTFGQDELPHKATAPRQVKAAVIAVLNEGRGGRSDDASTGDGSDIGSDTGGTLSTNDHRTSFGSHSASSFGSSSSFSSRFSLGSGLSSGFGSSGDLSADGWTDEESGSAFAEDGDEGVEENRSGVNIYTVHSEARTVNGTMFVREAVVNLAGADDQPFVINGWRQGTPQLFVPGETVPAVAASGP